MERRLALLALLVCAALAYRPLPLNADTAESESIDPFTLWEDYDETIDSSSLSRTVPSKYKTKHKVILKPNVPKITTNKISPNKVNTIKLPANKVNTNKTVIKKDNKSEDDKKVIKTTINIASHTNFIVTDRAPFMFPFINYSTKTPETGMNIKIEDQNLWVNNVLQNLKPEGPVQIQPTKNTRPATTARPRGTTKKKQVLTTRRTTSRTVRPTVRPTKKKKPCKTSDGWLSAFFRENQVQKAPKKEEKSGSFVGILSGIFSWIVAPWLGGSWFDEYVEEKSPSTTPYPQTTSTNNWFQTLMDSEENEDSHNELVKKPRKKSLKKNYKGYQLLRAYADVQWKVRSLLDFQEEAEGSGIMWWTAPTLNGSTDLLVPPDLIADVKDHLKSSELDFDVIIWDLQKAIMYENPKLSKKQRLELEYLRGHPMTWRRYHRYADILRYLEYLQHSHSDTVELVPLGRSSEGLPLVAVKVSKATNETRTKKNGHKDQKKKYKLRSNMKPAVWIEGGAHACEWIAPAVATWMLHNLVEGNDQDILNTADFYILPMMNPDGYEHTHTHDRLWRKTRSQTGDRSDDYYVSWFPWNWGRTECVGVDADRNWDYHWGEKGSSRDPCADNYAGQSPFSEPETRAVSEFLSDHRGQIKVYISLHAYSQAWLLPSSHANAPFSDDGVMMEMGKLATAALADMYGTKYQVGTADEIRQPASGMSHDWAKARAGIKFAYHVDLRDSFGSYGFLLPGSQIVSTAKETWQAIRAIVDNLSPGY